MKPSNSGFIFWVPLVAALFAVLAFVMDGAMLSVAAENIAADLGETSGLIVLALSIYFAVLAGLTIAAGKIADILGKRKMLIIGEIIFIAGSVAAAFSINGTMFLFSWSILKTIGAVFVLPVFASLLVVSYEGKDRATAFGMYAAAVGIAAVIGSFMMGVLSETITWRVSFAVTSFLILISIILLLRMKEVPRLKGVSIDWIGAVLLLISFFTIAFGVGQSNYWYLVLVGVAALGIFVFWVSKLEKQGKSPIFRLSIFGNRQFTVSSVNFTLSTIGAQGFALTFPIILAGLGGFSGVDLAIIGLPYFLGAFFGSVVSGPLGRKLEPKILVIFGFLLGVVGFISLFWILGSVSSFIQLIPSLLCAGAGYGLLIPWLQNIGLSSLNPLESGEGAGMMKGMSLLGAAIAVAIIGLVPGFTNEIVVGVFIIGLLLSFALPGLRKSIP